MYTEFVDCIVFIFWGRIFSVFGMFVIERKKLFSFMYLFNSSWIVISFYIVNIPFFMSCLNEIFEISRLKNDLAICYSYGKRMQFFSFSRDRILNGSKTVDCGFEMNIIFNVAATQRPHLVLFFIGVRRAHFMGSKTIQTMLKSN